MATYVDDLCIAAQNPGKIIQTLKEDYKFKVKGDGPLNHHLGADYTRDKGKTLVCQPKKFNLDLTSCNWSDLPLSDNPCDLHELTAALSHVIIPAKGDETQ